MAKKPKEAKEAPPPEAATPEEDAQGGKSSKLLLIAAVVLAVASLGGGFYLARMAFMEDAEAYAPEPVDDSRGEVVDSLDHKKAAEDKAEGDDHAASDEEHAEGDAHPDTPNNLLEFGEIVANIHSTTAQGVPTKAFLKINLVMVYKAEEGAEAAMVERQPFIRDLFNTYLRGLTEADIRGMVGLLDVKAELLKRARAAVGNDLPQEILINDLIVQ